MTTNGAVVGFDSSSTAQNNYQFKNKISPSEKIQFSFHFFISQEGTIEKARKNKGYRYARKIHRSRSGQIPPHGGLKTDYYLRKSGAFCARPHTVSTRLSPGKLMGSAPISVSTSLMGTWSNMLPSMWLNCSRLPARNRKNAAVRPQLFHLSSC